MQEQPEAAAVGAPIQPESLPRGKEKPGTRPGFSVKIVSVAYGFSLTAAKLRSTSETDELSSVTVSSVSGP